MQIDKHFHLSPHTAWSFEPVKVEVVFGNPKKGCSGSGICRMSTAHSPVQIKASLRSCRKALGKVSLTEEGKLKLEVYKYSLCNRTLRMQFGKSVFLAPESFQARLKPNGEGPEFHLTIKAGAYDLEESQYSYHLVFDMHVHDMTCFR